MILVYYPANSKGLKKAFSIVFDTFHLRRYLNEYICEFISLLANSGIVSNVEIYTTRKTVDKRFIHKTISRYSHCICYR